VIWTKSFEERRNWNRDAVGRGAQAARRAHKEGVRVPHWLVISFPFFFFW
jgi:hypothetical protein